MSRGLFRKTSFWKTVGAFRSQWKRALKRFFLPGYGKKGMGWWRNPKKAFYNWWYYRTSISLPRMLGYKPSRGACILALTMACFLNVFAAPVDVAKAATKAHKIKKARKARASGGTTTRNRPNSSRSTSSTYKSTPSSSSVHSKQSTSSTNKSTYSSYSSVSERTPSTKTIKKETPVKSSAPFVCVPDVEKKDPPKQEHISYEPIRLFEPVEPKVIVSEEPVEPDENIPKSIPKNENDQYIRKRMIIAGSYYCDVNVLSELKIGTYFDLEAEPDNPNDKDAVKLTYNGQKIGYIAKQDRLAFVTCLKLRRNIYGVITNIIQESGRTKYEFETWFDHT